MVTIGVDIPQSPEYGEAVNPLCNSTGSKQHVSRKTPVVIVIRYSLSTARMPDPLQG